MVALNLVAVLCRYWVERDANLSRIIDDLRASTVPPDEIVVWDQSGGVPLRLDATVIYSRVNFGTRARYVAALLRPAPWYLFVDDDVTVEPTTIERLMAHGRPGRVVTARGCVGDDPHSGRVTEGASHCDWLIGHLHLAHWRALARLFAAEERYRVGYDGELRCTDMLLGRVNDCVVDATVPVVDLPDGLVGLDKRADYTDLRTTARARLLEVGL